MGRRIGQLAGVFAFVIMMGRLGRLLTTGPDDPPWNLILAAATFLGGVAWWLLGQMTNRKGLKLTIFVLGGLILAFRIMVPETLAFGVIPTWDSLAVAGPEMREALRVIRSGVAPVPPSPGLLAILAVVMWSIGALFSWGSTGGPYAAMFLPSLVMYFQFAVFDRGQAGLGWMAVSGMVLGLSVVSMALDRRVEAGRARDDNGRPLARRSLALAAITAVLLSISAIAFANNASFWIDEYGNAPWRRGGSGGYGSGPGGSAYDGLVDLRQKILNLSDEPVFAANFGAGAPPANEVYWRMETLDVFDGEAWDRSVRRPESFEPGLPFANEFDTYQGTTYDFLTNVQIQNLVSELAPTPGVPVDLLEPPSGGVGRPPAHFRVLPDSAIVANPGLRRDDIYQVRAVSPDLTSDLGTLATGDDGELTAMFASAAAVGEFPYSPEITAEEPVLPPDLDFYTELPNLPSGIASQAQVLTFRADSDFERAFILQDWFRVSGGFQYTTDVSTGHDSLLLEDWLNDSTSQNYRRGYCEQFAAAMAVMARTLGIPSRVVWGFTPGEVTERDGEEIVIVRERNAHAWVEVWLHPYGWVQFDPTPRAEQTDYPEQPAGITEGFDPAQYLEAEDLPDSIVSPATRQSEQSAADFVDLPPPAAATGGIRWWLIGLILLIPALASVPAIKALRRRRRLEAIRAGDVTAAWDEIVDRLADLGRPIPPSLTPLEAARAIDPALLPLAVRYAAAVYGDRAGLGRESDLYGAELWIDNHYDTAAKARAAMSLRSLIDRS